MVIALPSGPMMRKLNVVSDVPRDVVVGANVKPAALECRPSPLGNGGGPTELPTPGLVVESADRCAAGTEPGLAVLVTTAPYRTGVVSGLEQAEALTAAVAIAMAPSVRSSRRVSMPTVIFREGPPCGARNIRPTPRRRQESIGYRLDRSGRDGGDLDRRDCGGRVGHRPLFPGRQASAPTPEGVQSEPTGGRVSDQIDAMTTGGRP